MRIAAFVISVTSTLRLVGAVGSGEEAIRLLPELRPDLVLLDLQMPGMDGIQTTRIIRQEEQRTVVIVISADLRTHRRTAPADRAGSDGRGRRSVAARSLCGTPTRSSPS
jgi:two-component system nitrate/nitrite response regulator NarL